jgi:hypothetical protein
MKVSRKLWLGLMASVAGVTLAAAPAFAQKKPNIIMLMTDDTGWNDFGAYCSSSDNLRLIRHFEKGGSGSSGVRV